MATTFSRDDAKVTVAQLNDVVQGMGAKNDARFANKNNVYTKAEVDSKITSAYKAGGSLSPAALVSSLLAAENEGKVYNVTGDFTTTADFVEGAGKLHTEGTNVAIVEATAAAYTATADTTAQDGKTYYADASGTPLDTQPTAGTDISGSGYYELTPATYKFDAMPGYDPVATSGDITAIIDALYAE